MLSLSEGANTKTGGKPPVSVDLGTRGQILAAALGEFSRKGFVGTTTKDISAAAGVAEVTLFRHFATKERLFEETLSRHTFVAQLEPLLRELDPLPFGEALEILCQRMFDALLHCQDWIFVMHSEVRRTPDQLLRLYQGFLDQLFGKLASFFRQRQERGELRSFDPEFAARALHGMVFCLFNVEELLLRKNYRPTDRNLAIKSFVDLLCHGTLAQ